ncbi:MAG: SRPBCC domain-containing protein [Pseudomonadota bacterium]
MTDTITKTVFLDAPREVVWSYLTEKDKLAQWFHPADADLAPGKAYALLEKTPQGPGKPQCWGKTQTMEPPSLLVYSFTVGPLNGAMTTVTWRLEEVSGGTRLTLTHDGVADAAGQGALPLLMALDAGWDEHFANLRPVIKALAQAA